MHAIEIIGIQVVCCVRYFIPVLTSYMSTVKEQFFENRRSVLLLLTTCLTKKEQTTRKKNMMKLDGVCERVAIAARGPGPA